MAWQYGMQANTYTAPGLVTDATRAFMGRVYRWMFAGLAITGGLAMFTVNSPALLSFVMRAYWLLLIAELVLFFVLRLGAQRMGGGAAALTFVAYAALNGLTLSGIFLAFRLGTIGEAFLVTAGTYGAMSAYGALTRKDLTSWGSFL